MGRGDTIRWILSAPELHAGLLFGLVATLAVVGLAQLPKLRARRPLPLADAAIALAALAALHLTRTPPLELAAGVAALFAAGALIAWRRPPLPYWPVLFLPGGLLAVGAWTGREGLVWPRILAVLTITVGGALATAFVERDRHSALSPGLALGTAMGVFVTVPDTEEALALLGVSLFVALIGWPLRWGGFSVVATSGWVAVLAWVTLTGGIGRLTSIPGALACIGVFALVPITRFVAAVLRREPEGASGFSALPLAPSWQTVATLVGTHAAFVLLASRGAGLRRSLVETAGILLVAGALAFWWLLRENRYT